MTLPDELQGIGIPWFEPTEWERARAVIADAGLLGHSHAEFVANLERVEHNLRRQGAALIRVTIHLDDFIAWCRLTGREVNAKSCADFAARLAKQHDDHGKVDRARRG